MAPVVAIVAPLIPDDALDGAAEVGLVVQFGVVPAGVAPGAAVVTPVVGATGYWFRGGVCMLLVPVDGVAEVAVGAGAAPVAAQALPAIENAMQLTSAALRIMVMALFPLGVVKETRCRRMGCFIRTYSGAGDGAQSYTNFRELVLRSPVMDERGQQTSKRNMQ